MLMLILKTVLTYITYPPGLKWCEEAVGFGGELLSLWVVYSYTQLDKLSIALSSLTYVGHLIFPVPCKAGRIM